MKRFLGLVVLSLVMAWAQSWVRTPPPREHCSTKGIRFE